MAVAKVRRSGRLFFLLGAPAERRRDNLTIRSTSHLTGYAQEHGRDATAHTDCCCCFFCMEQDRSYSTCLPIVVTVLTSSCFSFFCYLPADCFYHSNKLQLFFCLAAMRCMYIHIIQRASIVRQSKFNQFKMFQSVYT